MLKIYNSLTGKEEKFEPLKPPKVSLYVCGNTVYDYCHIGHARSMIMFDVVVRYLRYQGYEVTYVRNITDIDDKIIRRAFENHESIGDLTQRFIDAQHEDEKALGLLPPDHEPRATEFIPKMIDLIQKLCEKDYAYQAPNGDVVFNTRKFKDYGKLSGRKIEELISQETGADEPLNFVLWKMSKPNEPHWPSPWGEGRPGWHTECCAMSTELLGQPFDIHGGGMDLKFPHHENEIAQSEAACDASFAKIWMHVGLLNVDGKKMSKSLGNFVTIRDALAQYHPEELRFFMMTSLYNRPADYSERSMSEAKYRLTSLYRALLDLPEPPAGLKEDSDEEARFQTAMNENFNTSVALAILGDLGGEINVLRSEKKLNEAAVKGKTLKKLGNILGILTQAPEDYLKVNRAASEGEEIESLKQARDLARAQKNWAESDRIREQLEKMGLIVEDTPTGTRILRK